jgi:hypothetical protein
MRVNARRRGLGALFAIAVAVLPALVQPVTAGAASTGTLFGVTGAGWTTLSKIDPGTGTITPIAQFAGPDNDQITTLTGDWSTHRIFAIRTTVTFPTPGQIVHTSYILTINSQTGAFTSTPPVNAALGAIKYDTSSNSLYGLINVPTGQRLVRIDPSSGAFTTVASFASTGPVSMSMEVVPGGNTVYINRESLSFALPPPPPTSQVLTVTTASGAVYTGPVLSRATRSITYDASSNKLFGATECCPRDLVQIDPLSGTETFVGNIHATSDRIFGGNMVTDSASHTVFTDVQYQGTGFAFDDHIVSVNTQTGVSTTSPGMPGASIGALYFEGTAMPPASSGTLFGLTLGPQFGVARIDPASGATTILAPLSASGFGNSMGSDPNTHRLFLARAMQDLSTFPITTTYQILTVNSQSGALTVSPNLSSSAGSLVFDTSSSTLYGVSGNKQIVRIDPTTGAMTNLAAVGGDQFSHMVLAPASHTLYVANWTYATRVSQLFSMDTQTNTLTQGPVLATGVRGLAFDTSLNALFGLTFCCPSRLVRIDPGTGVENQVGSYDLGFFVEGALTIDSATHTIFAVQDVFEGIYGPIAHIASLNDQTGVGVLGGSTHTNVPALVFETARVDTSPPTTSIALSPAPNGAGWNNTDVTVNLSATDPDGVADVATVHYSATGAQTIAPTVVAGSTASFTLNTEGVTTISYFAKDKAGNTETAHTQVVRIDKTPPLIAFTGNAGTYTVDQTISITCIAADPPNANGTAASGLASITCVNVNAPGYTFPLGPTTLSGSASDVAGNIGSGSTTFTVQVTFASLCNLTVQFIQTSAAFQALPEPAQAQADRLCKILDRADLATDPEETAKIIEHYQKALPHLVKFTFLTADQAAILLALSKSL